MPLFESYDRRIKQINEALAKYGIGSIEEAEQLCLSKGCLLYTSPSPRDA